MIHLSVPRPVEEGRYESLSTAANAVDSRVLLALLHGGEARGLEQQAYQDQAAVLAVCAPSRRPDGLAPAHQAEAVPKRITLV